MMNRNRYREIQITYVHIITLIIAFTAISLFLFFLGYKIGKDSVKLTANTSFSKSEDKKVIKIKKNIDNSGQKNNQKKPSAKKATEIDKELMLHNSAGLNDKNEIKKKTMKQKNNETTKNNKTNFIKLETITRKTYYAIQIGAFRNHKGAKKEAEKFSNRYSTEIVKIGKLYKVRIGSFKTKRKAMLEIKKSPKLKGCIVIKIKR